MSNDEVAQLDQEMQPKLAAHYDQIAQNAVLFARIEAVYNSPAKSKLTAEQQRLVKVYYDNFVHAGAALTDERKARLSEIATRLAAVEPQPATSDVV